MDQHGTLLQPDFVSQKFQKLLEQYHLRRIRFHDLRHTNATLLIAAGTNLQTVAHRLGHADVTTTGKIYAHAIEAADAAANTLPDLLRPTAKTNPK